MQIYVGKNGQQLGPFTLDEVNRKLADGTFSATDLGWYEGAAAWGPLSGVPGVLIRPAAPPAPAKAPVAPSPGPAPAPFQPTPVAPSPAPVRPNASIVQPPRDGTGILAVISWILLGITVVVSFIPLVGCFGWVFGTVVAVAVIVMGIIMMVRGRALHGGVLLLAGLLIVPICFAAQFLSLIVFGGAVERNQTKQIIENLRTIDAAKVQWVAETKASNGAPVTMANLSKQLTGKTVSPTAMGETYDPMPVGQPPTATLPADKKLGKFNGGDVLTVASLEAAMASSSYFDMLRRSSPTPSPGPSALPSVSPKALPSVAPSVSASPQPSLAPNVTVSPRPSVSPRASSAPHSLISPRQSVEPQDSPSSRPSPSATFGPRVNPRQSPSEDRSNNENSTAPKQGRQYPRESPGQSPEQTPDDDDSDE